MGHHAGDGSGGDGFHAGDAGLAMTVFIANRSSVDTATLESSECSADNAEAGDDLGNLHYGTANVCQCRVNEAQRECAEA